MKKLMTLCIIGLLLMCGSAFATQIDLSGYTDNPPYMYDSRAGVGSDISKISFDYSYGNILPSTIGKPGFRIRRLNDDGSDSWLASINIYAGSFNVDTDFGPYSSNTSLSGTNHFEFTMNQTNGLWDLAINGSTIDFFSLSSTNSIQPDGFNVSGAGVAIANKYFSDESAVAVQNAIDLGMMAYTGGAGLGGTGAYRLEFIGLPNATGAFVDNIHVTPEPATLLLLGFGLLGLAGVSRRKN